MEKATIMEYVNKANQVIDNHKSKLPKFIRTQVELLQDAADIGLNYKDAKEIGNTEYEGRNVTCMHWDMILVDVGKIPAAKVMKQADNEYVIFVNTQLRELPVDEARGIILHELGHIVNGDLEDPKEAMIGNIKRGFGLATDREIKADMHAVNNGHGKGLIKALKRAQKRFDTREIRQRIAVLETKEIMRKLAVLG